MINRQLYLTSRPTGLPSSDNIQLREVEIPELQEGEILLENCYLSLDPAQRDWMSDNESYLPPIAIGEKIRSTSLGRVVASKHPLFKPNDYAVGLAACGWETHTVVAGDQCDKLTRSEKFPLRYYLSIFSGAMGLTPYFGITKLGRPQAGDTVLMSAAAGAVGSIAGQIAKILGCRVIGLAGSDDKCAHIVNNLGFDAAINYKTTADLTAALKQHCPDGIDIYFDNVGGDILDAALLNLAHGARVVFCGAISTYNATSPVPGPYNYWQILAKAATVEGLLTFNYIDEFPAALDQIETWLDEGKIQFSEDIRDGIESTVVAYRSLFTGENKGKLLVRLNREAE